MKKVGIKKDLVHSVILKCKYQAKDEIASTAKVHLMSREDDQSLRASREY
jgi:hypothetical protein